MSISAGLGLFEFPFSSARAFWKWVDLCDAGGVDSLWQSDRLVPEQPMLECMSTMAALAGATKHIKFGMNVASVGLRDPVLLARQCATIDMLSEGRLLPAFGIGNPLTNDWKGTGTPTRRRGKRTDEALDIIAALWRGERVTVCGEFHSCDNAVISVLPAQKNLPLWIGGSSDAAVRRIARIGTGWMGGRETPAAAAKVVQAIRAATSAAGRKIPDDHYGIGMYFRLGPDPDSIVADEIEKLRVRFPDRDASKAVVTGDVTDFMQRFSEYVDAGVSKFVLRPVARGDDDLIDQTKKFIETVLPQVNALNPCVIG
jgi:probable F420-dependent oxidoreductase